MEIPAVPNASGSNVKIVSDCILPQQSIEFEANITATKVLPPSFSPEGERRVYDIQGRQVSTEANTSSLTLRSSFKKGIYIAEGKKVAIK